MTINAWNAADAADQDLFTMETSQPVLKMLASQPLDN